MEWKKASTCPSCGYDEILKNLDELIIDSTVSEEREMGTECNILSISTAARLS